ncbi:MAG: hypothetical protein DSY83_16330 [Flavobacteriia bacterium]|nr:MAG: hypothetical protein DSY83_16330 [Flavobacteriia bacterium]
MGFFYGFMVGFSIFKELVSNNDLSTEHTLIRGCERFDFPCSAPFDLTFNEQATGFFYHVVRYDFVPAGQIGKARG